MKDIQVIRMVEGTTGVPVEGSEIPSPEVEKRRSRRRHTISYKLRVLETVSELRTEGWGAVGSYLRKEGLYYSNVRRWEQLQKEGRLTSEQSGPQGKSRKELQTEIQQLRRKLERTEKKLKKTEMIVELQKKLSSILAMDQETSDGRNAEQ